jgi:hypothetical protein
MFGPLIAPYQPHGNNVSKPRANVKLKRRTQKQGKFERKTAFPNPKKPISWNDMPKTLAHYTFAYMPPPKNIELGMRPGIHTGRSFNAGRSTGRFGAQIGHPFSIVGDLGQACNRLESPIYGHCGPNVDMRGAF